MSRIANSVLGAAALSAVMILSPAATPNATAQTSQDLRIALIDVEGGSAILFVSPEGKSLLTDTGWPPGVGGGRGAPGAPPPPPAASSADKIVAAAHALGLTKIDYLISTHYHVDHMGGFQALMDKIEIDHFIDHGPNAEPAPPNMNPNFAAFSTAKLYGDYLKRIAGKDHIVPKTGDTLDIGSMHLQFVSVAAQPLTAPLPGAGQPNPDCAGVQNMEKDGGAENHYSVSTLITFGKTRIAQFGDLSWNEEIKLLCPTNKVGKVDVYFVTQHGMDISSSPPTRALDPVVTIMGNGATKGGDKAPMEMVKSYPHIKDAFWMLHEDVRFPDLDPNADYIANLNQVPDNNYVLALAITPSGQITVTNQRNKFSKTYRARGAN